MPLVVEFALNNSMLASTGYTPFYVNVITHQLVPLTLQRSGSKISVADRLAGRPCVCYQTGKRVSCNGLNVIRHVCNSITYI